MIKNAKGITTKYIEQFIDDSEYYGYEDLHELAAQLVLKDTHKTTPTVEIDGDSWGGQIFCKFTSKVDGIPNVETTDFYGSCSVCDTLEAVYEHDNIKNDLATMVLHIIQSMSEQLKREDHD